jgi:GTPase SAR1 family protein
MGSVCGTRGVELPLEFKEDPDKLREAALRSKVIEKAMEEQKDAALTVRSLLLLGAGESGKSTLFKQAKHLYTDCFNDHERMSFLPVIALNVTVGIQTLLRECPPESLQENAGLSSFEVDAAKAILEEKFSDRLQVNPEKAKRIKLLWNLPIVQAQYERRSEFQFQDTVVSYFEKIDLIASPGYVPSMDDVLKSRAATTGVIETTFVRDKVRIRITDVGGQRSERQKWLHQFSKCNAIIFVAAISEYDQVLREDGRTNRMCETLILFEELANSRWLSKAHIILFLNKKDLFHEKLMIRRIDFQKYFEDYAGGVDYDKAIKYLQNLFRSRVKGDKETYIHVTCATDSDQIKIVFQDLFNIILDSGMKNMGLL